MRDSLVAINIINDDKLLNINGNGVPLLFYWDGEDDVLDSIFEIDIFKAKIYDVINDVISRIENWYYDLSIFNESCEVIFNKCLNEKLDLIRSLARKEFEKRYETKDIIVNVLNVQDISDEHYNRLIEDIYWDIKGLIIKPEDINDDLIREYF